VVPVAVGTALFFGRKLRKVSTGVQDKLAESTAVAEEAFSQIRTVQSFVQEQHEAARYRDRILGVVRAAVNRAQIRGVFFGAITFAGFGAMVVVLWQGGLLVLEGKLTAGSLFSFLLYTFTIAGAVGALASFFSAYQESVGAAERVFEMLETPAPIVDPVVPVELPLPVKGSVALEGVWFAYAGPRGGGAAGPDEVGQRGRGAAGQSDAELVGSDLVARDDSPLPRRPAAPLPRPTDWALQDLTLRLAPGEIVALVGPSGAGKTTVASLLPRFWDVTRGKILLDGLDIRTLRLADLRRAIGVVPQEPALFSGTIHENIAYARPDAPDEAIEAAARAAHAHEFIVRLPHEYQTLVGERGVKLSGGQRQRIAIARAILKDPALLILDEATSSLDTESERLIEDALEKLLVGRTTLIIAHRLSTVRRADRLVVLDRGRIVEIGTHAALLAEGGLYARLYQQQFREEEVPSLPR
jgi:subfamily B ATP-binding cassette protein MsbA